MSVPFAFLNQYDEIDGVIPIGHTLAGRYKILAALGAGGMGEVYRAYDQRLSRDVAVKILPDRVRFDENALSRFEREAKSLAALSHPNILSIYDSGTDQNISYAIIELLRGETLRQVLRGSFLPWKKVVEIAISIADGLSAAHMAGIIHRDLKPENVFLTSDQRVKILDFGLARRELKVAPEEVTTAQTASRQTSPDVVLGTVPYMAPEQIKGDAVDARTDIFSFGCLLYEMISGSRPFQGETSPEIMTAILKEDPPLLINVPPELQQIISHCLEKKAEERFQSARDLQFALKTILTTSTASSHPIAQPRFRLSQIGIFVVILLLVIAGWFFGFRNTSSPALQKSIAVLPFANLSGDKEEEYFSDGMTEDVITQISKIADLKVISRTSVMSYKNTKKSLREIGKEIGVAVILEGSVRRSGDRLRIVAQLINASTDEHIWADTYDREMKDVFEIQSDVAQHIADALKTKLSTPEKQLIDKKPTENLAAYDLYLKAREHLNRFTKHDIQQAIEFFKQAISLDPGFALAYAGLADAYAVSLVSGAPLSILDTSIETSKRAISLDPNLAEGYQALGNAFGSKGWLQKSMEMEKKALELNPNYARAAGLLGKALWRSGRLDESLFWVKKYQQLDPTFFLTSRYVGDVNRMLGNVSEAKKWFEYCLALEPNARECYEELIYTSTLYGSYEEVKPLEEKLQAIAPDEVKTLYALRHAELFFGHYEKAGEYSIRLPEEWKDAEDGYLLWKQGKTAEAEKMFSYLEEEYQEKKRQGDEAPDPLLGGIYAIRGDKPTAYRYLHEAVERGFVEYRILEKTPVYENLRNEAEFQQIIANLKGKIDEMRKRVKEQNSIQ